MPDGAQQAGVLEAVRPRDAHIAATASLSRNRDVTLVADEIGRALALADAGCCYEAREACAALMFDFQPVLAANPMLLQRFVTALRRCKAEQLLRRLSIAIHADAA